LFGSWLKGADVEISELKKAHDDQLVVAIHKLDYTKDSYKAELAKVDEALKKAQQEAEARGSRLSKRHTMTRSKRSKTSTRTRSGDSARLRRKRTSRFSGEEQERAG
jgi:predicted  nucleic acid-binding Zn-ribbon protein